MPSRTNYAVSFIPSQNYSSIKVLFNPDKLNAFSFGIATAPLSIQVPSNAQIGQYIIPILVNMSACSIFSSKFIQLANVNLLSPTQGYITTNANLTMSVVEPPSVNERVKDFWSTYGSLVSLFAQVLPVEILRVYLDI
jgi:hypothetical protein